MTESVEFYAGGLVGLCGMTSALLDRIGATADDTDDISGFPRSIQGVQIGVMIQELREGGSKISLRTGADYNASAICARLAAVATGRRGLTVDGDVLAAKKQILEAIAQSGVEL